eukprot:97125-Pelagomonas_calceolata.AAC.1
MALLRAAAGKLAGALQQGSSLLPAAAATTSSPVLSEFTRQMGTERRPGLSGAWKQSAFFALCLDKKFVCGAGQGGLDRDKAAEDWESDPTFKKPPRNMAEVLDDSASVLFLTDIMRGMSYTLGAFFDKKVTVSAQPWPAPGMSVGDTNSRVQIVNSEGTRSHSCVDSLLPVSEAAKFGKTELKCV